MLIHSRGGADAKSCAKRERVGLVAQRAHQPRVQPAAGGRYRVAREIPVVRHRRLPEWAEAHRGNASSP